MPFFLYFCITKRAIPMQVKRLLLTLLYWFAALFAVALVLSSLSYSFSEALFLACMFLPGSLCARFFWPKAAGHSSPHAWSNILFLVLGILIGELLLIMLANMVLLYFQQQVGGIPEVPNILVNPIFILLLLANIVAGDMFLSRWLKKRYPDKLRHITFVSNRRSITLPLVEIRYVESNDTEVWIYATQERKFRNKTPISQWERILGDGFVRIHRSYLVNRDAITGTAADSLLVGETQLPISRKYRDAANSLSSF